MKKILFVQLLLFVAILHSFAQKDSIIFNNNNNIIGEVKSMNRNVLKIETDYSDDDFTIEWDAIKEIYTNTHFLITLSNGSRYNGQLKSTSPYKIAILTDNGQTFETNLSEIVILDDIDDGFWSQVYASIDFGLDITKANNFKQFSMRSNIGYIAKRWQLDGTFNTLNTKQKDIDEIHRTDGTVTFKYFLPKDWYPLVSIEFLSNTEQQLDLRSSARLGIGKYFIHTNKTYWGFSLGANNNNESYTDEVTPDRNSWEGFIGTELNLFNVGDISLLTNLTAYPSFTESRRLRADFKFDIKYDLPLDFYIKLGYTLNYDNQPLSGSAKSDYVLHTGFGWEW